MSSASITASQLTLLERMKQLREANNTSIHSEVKTPTKLSTLLLIYCKADRECYIDYMAGLKALLYYLAPEGQPLDLELDKYPEAANPNFRVPSLLTGYAASEVAHAICKTSFGTRHDDRYHTVLNAIYFVMSKDVIYETY